MPHPRPLKHCVGRVVLVQALHNEKHNSTNAKDAAAWQSLADVVVGILHFQLGQGLARVNRVVYADDVGMKAHWVLAADGAAKPTTAQRKAEVALGVLVVNDLNLGKALGVFLAGNDGAALG